MGSCRNIGVICSLLWMISIICSSVLGILLMLGTATTWDALQNNNDIKTCIDRITVDIDPVEPIEYDILLYLSYALGGVFVLWCCVLCFFRDSESFKTCMICAGCLMILACWGSAAIYAHTFVYMYFVNEEFVNSNNSINTSCAEDEEWTKAFLWAWIGGGVAAGLVIFWCCACYIIAFTDDDGGFSGKNDYGGSTYNNYATSQSPSYNNTNNNYAASNSRALAIRNDNDNYAGSTYGGSTYGGSQAGSGRGGDVQLTDGQKQLVGALISLELIEKCGFSIATNLNKAVLLEVLKTIEPSGQTALRDAVALGVSKMLSLKLVLNRIGVIGHQFIHIVLTDGADNRSQNTLTDIQGMYYEIGKEIGDAYFKTFFIGIGLGYTEKQQLQSIADLAGDAAELFNCNDVQISDVFDRIKLSLGIQRRVALITDGTNFVAAKQDRLFLQAERQKFLVLFDLDMSGSMGGNRWMRLQGALAGFFDGLDDSDIIGCVLFNHQAVCITGEILNKATA